MANYHVTMTYSATAAPTVLPATLVTAMGAVPLDYSDLISFSVIGVASDSTAAAGPVVTRTIELTLEQVLFDELFPPACPNRVALFENLFTNQIANGIIAPVTWSAPVLS